MVGNRVSFIGSFILYLVGERKPTRKKGQGNTIAYIEREVYLSSALINSVHPPKQTRNLFFFLFCFEGGLALKMLAYL